MVIPLALFVPEALGIFSVGQKMLLFYPELELTFYSDLSFIIKIQTKVTPWKKVTCCSRASLLFPGPALRALLLPMSLFNELTAKLPFM